jgi:hypothetical protein
MANPRRLNHETKVLLASAGAAVLASSILIAILYALPMRAPSVRSVPPSSETPALSHRTERAVKN